MSTWRSSSNSCLTTGCSLFSLETRRADGEDSGMINRKAECSRTFPVQLYTPMTSREVKTPNASYTQTILVSVQCTTHRLHSVEQRLSNAQDELTPYYESKYLRANPSKRQVRAFLLCNHDTNGNLKWSWTGLERELKLNWSGTTLEHFETPVYLEVTLEKTRSKVCSRNNIWTSFNTGSIWGARPDTLRSTVLPLC